MEDRGKINGKVLQHGAARARPSPQQLLECYGDQLDGETLNDEQAKECLSALWSIMVAFVDLGFSVKAGDKLHPKSDIGMDDVLQYLCLEDTAPETVASSKITYKKEPR
ncbi:hypothetical protein OB2597_06770 [Pseudooceanicola batsensis HTCC2597]|uniref:Uncharacterized protein n=1 Tax=Pseudooceanicola batsensis (strain ATCC BAA-863 / DSM 15984 / KCTC 12145 / HTCC2597) TaxID=252305 RepID=A3TTI9_PSEBH|nr:hypothetical protein [Pseudooceanicola batsensis]EAQ04966.1 hypothetical protein OB2597_06770 [Pseudooceanicola batsensis HTCC2597]